MAVTSVMLPLGTTAPAFSLPDVRTGDTVSLDDLADKPVLLVMFICRHCPYVRHVAPELARLGTDYQDGDVAIVAIGSNDAMAYPEDAPDSLAEEADQRGYPFPVLYDESQEVAAAYTAACTPDFFLFDADRTLRYRGRLDSSRPNTDTPLTGEDLRAAIEAVHTGGDVDEVQFPSVGCSIKWRPGNAPPYAS